MLSLHTVVLPSSIALLILIVHTFLYLSLCCVCLWEWALCGGSNGGILWLPCSGVGLQPLCLKPDATD